MWWHFDNKCPFSKILQSCTRRTEKCTLIPSKNIFPNSICIQCLYMNWRIVIIVVQQFLSVALTKFCLTSLIQNYLHLNIYKEDSFLLITCIRIFRKVSQSCWWSSGFVQYYNINISMFMNLLFLIRKYLVQCKFFVGGKFLNWELWKKRLEKISV